ncbi:S8 family serine peptidase [Dokdonia sp. 4H-3-7-5]|uniref:S8 family serine peptidase n=1 Tax=Dokdonia sp. (strain 4H-3-7-5) TaxID=983548 RepID=UPI0002FA9812|nr:S8 family serine peptidase [Dokdonia sp. 4H-3-7-5]
MNIKLLLVLLLMTAYGNAQQDAWVFFVDKENVAASLDNPISILTQDALDRKELHGVAIDERDVPVNENYITQIKSEPGITVLAKSKWMNCVHVRGSLAQIEALEALQIVDYIEYADRSITRQATPFEFLKGDPLPPQSRVTFNYGATDNQVTMLSVDELHEQDFTGAGMVIAIMDSGFPGVNNNEGFSRLRNAGNLLDGYDFVGRNNDEFEFSNSSHGTRVASDIVGFIENQFVGTAPDAAIYCFRTEDVASENPVEESYWVEAAERADSLGVDVINTSLGYRTFDNSNYDYSYDDMDGETTFISRGATLAFEKGMLVVTSAGNSGTGMISAPADAVGSFTVGAVNASGNYASFSSIGPSSDGRIKPDVVAKGAGSAVIDQNDNITTNNGTSFSSPIMAGAIASFWQANPELTNAVMMQLVRESASIYDNPTVQLGYGIPDFGAALEEVLSTSALYEVQEFKDYQILPNPASEMAVLVLPKEVTQVEVTIFDILGKKITSKRMSQQVNALPISTLKKGVYLIQINDGNSIVTQKFIKA